MAIRSDPALGGAHPGEPRAALSATGHRAARDHPPVHDLVRRLIQHAMIERLQGSADDSASEFSPGESASANRPDTAPACPNAGNTAPPNRSQVDDGDVIDWDEARNLIPGGDEAIASLAVVFQQECTKLLSEIDAGLASADASRVSRGAHTLKGAAECFGARTVIELARTIEQMGREDRLSELATPLAELHRQAEHLLVVLEEFIAQRN